MQVLLVAMEELASMESTVILVSVLLDSQDLCVKQTSTSAQVFRVKTVELALMESTDTLATVDQASQELYVKPT